VQDWDRGLIVGSTTYGKGLVQQLFPLSNDGTSALKLTTAKYYVPSGRCIQKPERQGKDDGHGRAPGSDDTDTLTVTEREIFYTNGGRIVFGGGGIVPDVTIERELWKPIEINLERQSVFFDFAISYVSEHPDIQPHFEITEEMIEEFRAFVAGRDFTYKTSIQVGLEELEETINDDDKGDVYGDVIDDMMALVEESKKSDFDESREYIERAIKREIARAIAGERGVYEQVILKRNKTVQKAIDLLSTPQEYSRLITEGQKHDEM
jgi:carboxyl-terminal processing protease